LAISHPFRLKMRNVSDKSCTENQNTHFTSNNFYFKERALYKTMWKNIVEPARPQMIIWHMHIPCCTPKATNTCSEHVILIAFPLHQWLREHAAMLCYTYIACLVRYVYFILMFTLMNIIQSHLQN